MSLKVLENVNDTNGHVIGDGILFHIASILKNTVRVTDLVARYGREEFTILSYNLNEQQEKMLAKRIRQAVDAAPYEHTDIEKTISVTVSIGISVYYLKNDTTLIRLTELIE